MSDPNDKPDATAENSEESSNPRERPMGFFDHLEELRWTLVKSAGVYLLFAILIGIFLKEFNDILLWPFHYVKGANPNLTLDLGTTSIMEGFTVIIQMCFLGALPPAAPFILYFIGQFVAPALTAKEMKMAMPTVLSGVILFLLGACFSFFLLVPSTLRVSLELNQLLGFVMRWTPGSYYSLLTWLVLGVGAAFEFPLLIVLLVYLGILQVSTLRKYRRHAIVAIFIVAAIVTPTPDPVTQTLFAAPLYVLFELSIIVSASIEKKRKQAQA